MPTTANTINYYVAADGTLRDGPQGSIAQQPRINYGTEYAVTLTFPPSTIAEGDQLQVALNRTRTFFSSASATGDAPVAAVAKHDVTAEEAAAQEVAVVLSTNTRAMIDQVNGIDHPVRGFFGVHVLRGQSFVTLAVADALMMSLESGPDAISPSLPVVDYPTRDEAEALAKRSERAADAAEEAQDKAEKAQGAAEEAETNAQIWAGGTDLQVEELGGEHSAKEYDRRAGVSATNAEQSATNAGQSATDAGNAKTAAQTAQRKAEDAQSAAETAQANAGKIAEGSDADVAPLGLEHSAKVWAQEAAATLASKRDILQTLVTSSSTALVAEAGKSYNWTVSAASTIALATADKVAGKETRIDIYIDLQDGGSVTGDGVAVADAVLQSGWYKLIWDGTNATLYSTKAGGAASVITIPAATTAYTLQDNKHYQQVPDAVPTYTLPVAFMDGLVHEITVLVDFMHVTSCSFVDAGGVPVTLQSAISPQIGEAYIFRCYWYGKWRVVPLKIRNAATASSSNGVLEVSGAVAGDALALKMTAPRSVVVNQLIDWDNAAITRRLNDTYATLALDRAGRTATLTIVTATDNNGFVFPVNLVKDHIYIFHGIATCNTNTSYTQLGSTNIFTNPPHFSVSANTDTPFTAKRAVIQNAAEIEIYPSKRGEMPSGKTFAIADFEIVDLTQYFNGNATLINSIASWDDLVAYDPSFASYVPYNTGTVTGVQPTVKVTGKNLFDKTQTLTAGYQQRDGTIYNNSSFRVTDYIPVLPDTHITITYTLNAGSSSVYICLYDANKKLLSSVAHTNTTAITLTTPAGCCYMRDSFRYADLDTYQIELGSTATAYEPYHDGGTAQAPAPLFAVGSAADEFEAVAGVTTRKVGSYTFTGNEMWSVYNEASWRCTMLAKANGVHNVIIAGYISDSTASTIHTKNFSVCGFSGDNDILIRDINYIDFTDAASFAAHMAGKTIYYELATPVTSASTPAQISLQAGSNTAMQTDGGRTLAELAMTYENLPSAN